MANMGGVRNRTLCVYLDDQNQEQLTRMRTKTRNGWTNSLYARVCWMIPTTPPKPIIFDQSHLTTKKGFAALATQERDFTRCVCKYIPDKCHRGCSSRKLRWVGGKLQMDKDYDSGNNLQPNGWRSAHRYRYCWGRSKVQSPGRSDWTQCRQRLCNVSSELCSPGTKPRRWIPPFVTRFGVIPQV